MTPTLSVIIPTRNEHENAPRVLAALRRALDGVDYELVFVDDSTDGTERVLGAAAADDPRVAVLHRDGANGLASAVIDGIRRSRGDAIAVMDADLQHPPALLPVMLRRLEEASADIVVASRYRPGASYPGLSPWRRLASRGFTGLARLLLRTARRSTDPLGGFFVVRRTAVADAPLRPIGWKILLEILVRGRCRDVAEVPYVFDARAGGRSKASARQAVALVAHLAMLAASSPGDARVWKFLLVGATGVVVNMIVFWILVHLVGVYYVAAGFVAGGTATVWNYIWNSAFTWADRPADRLSAYFRRMGRYYVTTWAGQGVYLGVLWFLGRLDVAPLLANLVGILVGGSVNYLLHDMWTWRQRRGVTTRGVNS